MPDHPFRKILDKYTDVEVSRECMRQLWQCFDASGHSMGRSLESALLEATMGLIGNSPDELMKLADGDPRGFLTACEELKHDRWREAADKRDAEFWAREDKEDADRRREASSGATRSGDGPDHSDGSGGDGGDDEAVGPVQA